MTAWWAARRDATVLRWLAANPDATDREISTGTGRSLASTRRALARLESTERIRAGWYANDFHRYVIYSVTP